MSEVDDVGDGPNRQRPDERRDVAGELSRHIRTQLCRVRYQPPVRELETGAIALKIRAFARVHTPAYV